MSRAPLAAAVLAALAISFSAHAVNPATPVQPASKSAQQTDTQAQAGAKKTQDADTGKNGQAKELKAVTVSGSLLPRVEYQTTVPIQSVNIKADVSAGLFGTADMLQSTAVAAGATQINNQFSGYIVGGGTGIQTIDLRGLGANRTLVLLDGQRPGPAGTRGQTGAGFDLNVVPSVILQRVEIVKDGSSSIYGSDAISGVVNLITKEKMDRPEFTTAITFPSKSGGKQVTASLGTGWNFESGNIVLAAQFQEQFPLQLGQRDYTKCPQDLVWGKDGQRIDRKDFSILKGTRLAGCNNLYANTIIDYFDFGTRYVPSADGSTVGPFAGYHPRPNPSTTYADGNPNGAYYEDVLNYPFSGDEWLINRNRNSSLYASSRFHFGDVGWTNQFLFNHRQTNTHGFRQFFPTVYDPNSGSYYLPIMPFPSNVEEKVNYYYLRSELDGAFGDSSWSWNVNATHSRSQGTYSTVGIDARVSGDLTLDANTLGLPPVNYFDPGYLSGQKMSQLVDAIGIRSTGRTDYTQSTVKAVVNGDLFSLPAGYVSAAFGAEYRHYKIDDEPSEASRNGWLWGSSSAQVTKGADHVSEVFGEVGIPLLSDVTGFKSLTADISARRFKYASVGSAANVWKYGLNWQINDSWRLRGTIGTSYRAPALYELYLGNQTGFLGQISIDPCIQWADSTNDFIRKNCAAAGIPGDYAGGGASATVYQGGGKGFLDPETSRAKSVGVVWTPSAEFNVAVDYFDYHIEGEISTLGASDILYGCYGRPTYPNAFCDLFNRNAPDAAANANQITDVHATYININSERTRGYDLQVNYNHDYSFGQLVADAQVTYTIEDSQQLFDSAQASGYSSTDFVGYIGRPKTVGIADVRLKRGNWTYSWQGQYVSTTRNKDIDPTFTYFGYANAGRDITAGWQFRHSVSVGYEAGHWEWLFGIRNLFDKAPDLISSGVDSRKGNVPLNASQYDWYGRTFFLRANYKF